ncbi:VWA domain-containing protein [Thiosocius teredinicola]|uniref:VWA domain-containing protein n=1 Tax=Thiosocius teredinicola TaxID=1973002 RepID=UPI0009911A12
MRFPPANRYIGRLLLLAVLLCCAAPGFAAPPQQADVRVLIDISGSMKKNDPNNLRRPALRMLSGLLQPGTRAGVWTFAHQTNNLVPVADVDDAWKKSTKALSQRISSPGQFTNIEDVLDKASADWSGEPDKFARHLVLLTDGMVDVSKKAEESTASRERILDTLLPRLKAAGVKVHTIALSERADHELMKALAGDTGGWYQQVEHADELQRVFLHMFEQVGKPDAVPLQDNRFVVDGSVSEATVLLFSKPDAKPAVLHSPNGESYTDSDLPAGVAWFRDQGYDLITIASPQKGEWRLEADVDPDNRVMVVTDLKLQTSEIPAHIAAGETTPIEASLSNRGKVVTRQAFLRLLQVHAAANTGGETSPLPLNDTGESGDENAQDGRYSMQFGETDPREELELVVAIDSPTFMREKRFRMQVHAPMTAEVVDADGAAQLNVALQTAVMQGNSAVTAWQQAPDGSKTPLALSSSGEDRWQAVVADRALPTYVQLSGQSRLGNLVERTSGPLMAPGVEPPPAEPAPVEQEPVEEVAAQTEEPAPAEPQPEPEEVSDTDWMAIGLIIGGVNLLLLIVGGVWFFLRKRRAAAPADDGDIDALADLDDGNADAEDAKEDAA